MKNKLIEQVPELTKVSSKGQLVIPKDIRKHLKIKEGDVFATTSADYNLIILKKIKNPILKKDLILLKDIEEAWKEIEQGRCKTHEKEEFLKELKKW
ncbi:AbrB/MazE/SpoVT family DNA-binding domain-containing protein [Candidatus Woesearchaeota archaeon]|nr:AbrB/MazE/SpoVT family DNA-binding domain-containing protein [Candidatus Woesearchaeota archaeon]